MSSEEQAISQKLRVGYLKPLGQPMLPVVYSVVGSFAVIEGDILLGPEKDTATVAQTVEDNPILLTDAAANLEAFGAGVSDKNRLWPQTTMPFRLDPGLTNADLVRQAIKHWETELKAVGLDFTFREKTSDDTDFVHIRPDNMCASNIGRMGKRQDILLTATCSFGNIVHEIGHALGLFHEQSRHDRDENVKIHFERVKSEARHNFERYRGEGKDLGAYDYGSIMHYPATAFAKVLGQVTIETIPAGTAIGQRVKLSAGDVAAVKKLYSA